MIFQVSSKDKENEAKTDETARFGKPGKNNVNSDFGRDALIRLLADKALSAAEIARLYAVGYERARSMLRRMVRDGVLAKCGWFYSVEKSIACRRAKEERVQPHGDGTGVRVLRALKAGYSTVDEIVKATGLSRSRVIPALARLNVVASAGRYPFRVYAPDVKSLRDRILFHIPDEVRKTVRKLEKVPIRASDLRPTIRKYMFQLAKDGIVDVTKVGGKIIFHLNARPEEILAVARDEKLPQLKGIATEIKIKNWLNLVTGLKFHRYKNFDAVAWLFDAPIVVEIKDEKRVRGSEITEFYNKTRKEFGPGALMFLIVSERTRVPDVTRKLAQRLGIHIVIARS